MDAAVSFSRFDSTSARRVKRVEEFLSSVELKISSDIETFVLAKENGKIIACGGIAGNILKCIAISPEKRGEGFFLSLMTELLNTANDKGRKDLFIFSSPKNRLFFEECGFRLIQECDNQVILMENSENLAKYKKSLSQYKKDGTKIGSIVMNANPFTLGHQYLVESAASQCEHLHLFVVGEDASEFSFVDRLRLIKEGTLHIKNVTVHEGSDYIISKATFPTYFIKNRGEVNQIHAKLDLNIFKDHLAPTLGITHRFVGDEPHCKVTNNYNQNMKRILQEVSNSVSIKVIEVPRKQESSKAISASRVRGLLKEKRYEELSKLVPKSTFDFLIQKYRD